MKVKHRFLVILLVFGDIVVLYASLFVALWIRKQFSLDYDLTVSQHIAPFSILFGVWLFVFFLFSLYDPRVLKNNISFLSLFGWALVVNFAIAVIFFYLIPVFGVTPKTNLALFFVIFIFFYTFWRRKYNRLLERSAPETRVLLVGANDEINEAADFIARTPQFGYTIALRIEHITSARELEKWIRENAITAIALPHEHKQNPAAAKAVMECLKYGVEIIDHAALYELSLTKIPVSSIQEAWFIEHLGRRRGRVFDALSRGLDVLFAILMSIVFFPIIIIAIPLITVTSRGPVIYKQTRVGKDKKEFVLYKFRTMRLNAEQAGPQWSSGKNDARVTAIGKILRKAHFDELPQIVNIIKGELSLVGPRPERPEFVQQLENQIPFYGLRHLIRPGVTGWAQINYRYGASAEDAYKKLQYDIYYVKNRSLTLYLITVFKTARVFVHNPE